MATRLFRCPSTGHRVQDWFADNGSVNGDEMYEGVTCLACISSSYCRALIYRAGGRLARTNAAEYGSNRERAIVIITQVRLS